MSATVIVETTGGVATLRLNRPPLNTFDDALRRELGDAVHGLADDDTVGAVVLTGNTRAFAAGADLNQLVAMDYEQISGWNRALQRVFDDIARLPMPVVAAVDGYALGGGLELALAADFRFLGEQAQLALPEVQLGILPGAGGVQRLRRLVGVSRAKELLMSGRRVHAAEAVTLGLADRVVPGTELLDTAQQFAATLAGGPRFALRAIKEAVDLGADASLAAGLALDRNLVAGLFATADRRIGMRAFLERGPGRARFGGGEDSA